MERLNIIKDIPELRKLILENPELPICVLVNYEVVWDEYAYTYASSVQAYIGEILDCEVPHKDGYVFNDRDDLREHIEYYLEEDTDGQGLCDEEFEKLVDKELEKYELYWVKAIIVRADN
jgi:hypothetical protein